MAAADDGMKALLHIGQSPPDLLILDIGIPNINGLKLIELLRAAEHSRPVKIIVVTGQDLRPPELAFIREHAEGFFPKPLEGEAFLAAAARCLDLEVPQPAAAMSLTGAERPDESRT